jgi:hypothetical protein
MKSKLREIKLLLAQLDADHQQAIVDYANFLVQRYKTDSSVARDLKPESIERPGQETVIAAIKRLKKTYYMLDTDSMLSQTSALMGQHILKGREASDVIDELQSIFQTQYEQYLIQ